MNLDAYDDYTSGISDNKISDNDISISVSQASDYIDILGADNADVRIFAVNGSCVFHNSGVSGRISVSSLVKGVYIVEVKAEGKILRKKIILQ